MTGSAISELLDSARKALSVLSDDARGAASQNREGVASAVGDLERAILELQSACSELDARGGQEGADLALASWVRSGLTRLLERSADGYITTDLAGRILSANAAACELLGQEADALTGRRLEELAEDRDRATLAAALEEAEGGDRGGPASVAMARPDGSPLVLEVTAISAPLGHGEKIHCLLRDVTAQAAAQARLREAQRMEAMGRLAGGVAHEFSNLLLIINGQAQFVIDELDPNDPVRQDMEEIQAAGRRAAELTGELLAFSRREDSRLQVLDANQVLGGMARMLRRLIGEDLRLELDLARSPMPVRADQGRLEQIVMNLAINARDAMPTGGTLRLATRRDRIASEEEARDLGVEPGVYVRLDVQDTGEGMSSEVQQRLFQPYFTTKARGRGTGLGLSLVSGLVRQFEGGVRVASEVGAGTTVSIYLPYALERAAQSERLTQRLADLPGGSEHILVVEDDALVRRMTVRMLRRLGYRLTEAGGAAEALEALDREGTVPDLLLTDVVMPDESGRELAHRLVGRFPDLRVLYMSGYPREKLGPHGIVDPGIRVLQKPFTVRRLAAAVREALDEPRALEAGAHGQRRY